MDIFRDQKNKRKFVHFLFGIFLYLLYLVSNNPILYSSLLFFTGLGIVFVYGVGIYRENVVYKLFSLLKKTNEFMGEGALYLVSSFIIASLTLNQEMFFVVFWFVTVSDTFSAIIGRKYGKIKTPLGKSVEGSLAFFVSSIPLLFMFPEETVKILLYIIISTIIESINRLEDNVTIVTIISMAEKMIR